MIIIDEFQMIPKDFESHLTDKKQQGCIYGTLYRGTVKDEFYTKLQTALLGREKEDENRILR